MSHDGELTTPVTLEEASLQFSAYQHAENQPKYANAVCARVQEFIHHCNESGVRILVDVEVRHVREWLRQTPKRTHPGAWKSRYLAMQTFFNYGVFMGILDPRENPLAASPRGATLTNKPMLTELDFHRLLMVIPATHTGIQDKLVCHLLWHGWTLRNINNLRVSDVMYFPIEAKEIAEGMLTHRRHTHDAHLWLDALGNPRTLHGQKLNKRLQKNAELAELPNPSRISASLLYQSGTYHRILSCEEEK